MKKKNSGRPKRLTTLKIAAAAVALAIVAGIVWLVAGSLSKGGERASELRFDVYSDNVFAILGDGLASASGAGIQLLDGTGETYAAKSVMLQRPDVQGVKGLAAAWGIGEKDFYVLSSGGIEAVETAGAVITAAVNSSGYIAVAAEEDGYKGAVTVYNARQKAIYKWYSGSAYLIGADIADGGERLAALTLSGTGSRVVVLGFSDTGVKGEYLSEDKVFFDVGFLGNSQICAVSDKAAVFIDERGKEISSYVYPDGYLSAYSLEGSGFAAFVTGKYRMGGESEIATLDTGGKLIASKTLKSAPDSISAAGKYIAAIWSDRLVIYRQDLSEYAVLEDTEGMTRVVMREDGTAVLISGRGAVIFRP